LKPDLAMPAHTTGMIPATKTAPYEINIQISWIGFFLDAILKPPKKSKKKPLKPQWLGTGPARRRAHRDQPPFLERLPGFFLLRVATPRSRLTR
jgi:hypothetical protein